MHKDLTVALAIKSKIEQRISSLLLSPAGSYRNIDCAVGAIFDYLSFEYPTSDVVDDFIIARNAGQDKIDVTLLIGAHTFPMTFMTSWFAPAPVATFVNDPNSGVHYPNNKISVTTDINYIQTDEQSVIEFEYDNPTIEIVEADEATWPFEDDGFEWPFPTGGETKKQSSQKELNDAYERAKKAVDGM